MQRHIFDAAATYYNWTSKFRMSRCFEQANKDEQCNSDTDEIILCVPSDCGHCDHPFTFCNDLNKCVIGGASLDDRFPTWGRIEKMKSSLLKLSQAQAIPHEVTLGKNCKKGVRSPKIVHEKKTAQRVTCRTRWDKSNWVGTETYDDLFDVIVQSKVYFVKRVDLD